MVAIQSSSVLLLDTNLLLLLFIGGKDTSLIKKAKTLSAIQKQTTNCYKSSPVLTDSQAFSRLLISSRRSRICSARSETTQSESAEKRWLSLSEDATSTQIHR